MIFLANKPIEIEHNLLANKPIEIEHNLFGAFIFLVLWFLAIWGNILALSFRCSDTDPRKHGKIIAELASKMATASSQ